MLCSNAITLPVRGRAPGRLTPRNRGGLRMARRVDFPCAMHRWLPLLVAISTLSACSVRSQMVHRPADTSTDAAISAMWVDEIRRVGRDGDWLLSRAYAAT